jgi:hypothetical protein
MKTNEELLEMSGNDFLKYCESLTYFTIDRDDFHILTALDIIVTKIEYNKEYKLFELSYHFENSNIYDDNFKRVIQSITFTTRGDYCGLFESRQDAINAAKQDAKKEILGQIDSRKLQIKEFEKKLERLENL